MGLAWVGVCGCLVLAKPSATPASATPASAAPASAPGSTRERPLETLPRVEPNEALAHESWEKGAKAFGEGRFEDAIGFFEKTYRYSGRPGPLFSLGQAHRHRWQAGRDEGQRQLAILRYRQYLLVDPDGPRQLEAERWIAELSSATELEGMGGPPPIFTRLGLSSRTPGATARIDGGPAHALPDTPDVEPGTHTIVVSARGFHPQSRTVDVPEGSTLPVELTLDPVDALLTVRGPADADLWVDGQRVARLPTKGPVAIAPGRHQIGVAKPGRSLYVLDLELGHGEREHLDVTLERTAQRKASFAVLAIGSTATAASIVLMGVAFDMQRRAAAIADDLYDDGVVVTDESWDEHRRYVERRDGLRTAAIATGVSGLTVLATGIVLYLTDRPPVASQLHRRRPSRVEPGVDVTSSFAGGSLRGWF